MVGLRTYQHPCITYLENSEDLHDLYFSPNIIGAIKSRRMRWVGNVALMGEKGDTYGVNENT
jgi:hypothetical protein